uniref:hypothetical protein n=1 Tax=uncultured Thiohalocapsa sp. TaxID=768990 RepID=UPI0025E5849B
RAAARRTAAVAAARAQRAQRLSNVPPALRDTLAALPDHALVLLRAAQAQDRDLRPAERARMLDDALRSDPDLDRAALDTALDAALAAGRGEQGQAAAERARLRAALLDSVPAAQRHLVAETPVIVMRADEFAAMTRSASGQAVTMIIHGEPVVVLREGADPGALGEEGLHVLQARDPDWARHIEALEEVSLADWQRMPLAERIARYGNKLELEIDAQQRRIADLETRLGDAADPAERRRLADQLELSRTALANLSRRAGEVAALTPETIQAMAAGVLHSPDWLEQPPRLFQKDSRAPPTEPTPPEPSLANRIDAAAAAPDIDAVRPLLAELAALGPAHPLHARLAGVIDALPADAQARLRDEIIGETELARLAAAAGARPSALRRGAQALHPLELQGLLRLELDPVLAARLIRTSGAESGAHGPPSAVRDLLAVAAAADPGQIATLAARVASVERVDHRREVAAHLRSIAGAIKQPDTLAALLASLPVRDRGSPDARFVPSALAPARRLVEAAAAAGDEAQLRRLAEHLAQASETLKAALLEPLAREPSLLALVELDAAALPGLLRQGAALSHLGDGAEAAIGNFVRAVQRHAAGLSAGNSARLFAGLSRMEVATGQQRSALRVALAMLVVAEGVHLDVADIPALRRALIDAVVGAAAHKPDIAEALGRVFPALGADAQGQLADLLAKGGDAARIGLLEAVAQLRHTLGELDVPEVAPDALLADLLAVARDQDQYVAFLARTERLLRAAKAHETERRAAAEAGAADDHKPGLRDLVDYLRAGRDDASRRAALGPDVHRADNRLDTKVGIDKLLGGLGNDPPSLAEGDAWVQQLAEADARWQDQVQRTPKPLYAALVEDATPQPPWSDGQRGTLLEHAPWLALRLRFEIETRLAQGDPPVVLDQAALADLLGALRTGLATGAADTGLRIPVGTDTLVLTWTELAAMLKGIIDARQPTTAAQHSRIARAFRDSAADASRRVQQSLTPDAATVERLLDSVSASGAARQSEVLREHLINLYQQQVRYALLVTYTDVLGTGAEGLKQQVTEVVGELALTRFMLEREPTPTLIGPFEKGTGFDQVWRDPDGTLLVCEAKGPGAKLGEPDKGEQMTGQWVLATLLEMIRAGDSPKVDGEQLGDLLLRAALTGDPRLRGEVVQASDSNSTAGTSIAQAKHGRPHYALRDADLFDDPHIRGLLATPRVRSKLEAMLAEMPQDDPFVRRVLALLAEAAEE